MKRKPTNLLTVSVRATGCLLLLLLARPSITAAQGVPGCPPSLCPAADTMNPSAISRLTLFPGTPNVVHDNGPGDLDPACGVLRVEDVPFPGPPFSNGFGAFSGKLIFEAPQPSGQVAGELRITEAEIRTGRNSSGNLGDFRVIAGQKLPFACGEFLWTQGLVTATLTNSIDAILTTAEELLQGSEEVGFNAVARSFTTLNPPPTQQPPSLLFVEVIGPGISTPGPAFLNASATSSGTYTDGLSIIGLRMEGINLPQDEAFRLPDSIGIGFGGAADIEDTPGLAYWGLILFALVLTALGGWLFTRRSRAPTS